MRPVTARILFYVVCGIAAALVAVLTLVTIIDLQGRNGRLLDRIADQNAQITELTDAYIAQVANGQTLYDQLMAIPDVEPQGEDPSTLETPSVGVPGATGATGSPGTDGRPPTAAEVLAAVESFCLSRGGCQGVPGQNGTNGTSGTDGAPGSNGADGATGATGPEGAQGRGVASVSCALTDDGTSFRFTFTDGTTQDVPASCVPA